MGRAELIALLREHGVVAITDFVAPDIIEQLMHEFQWALSAEGLEDVVPTEYSIGRASRIYLSAPEREELKAIRALFKSEFCTSVSCEYFESAQSIRVNDEVFAVKDVVGSRHIANDPHFDVLPTLKFFLYLTDTTEENGAFKCVPGSQVWTAQCRERYGADITYENRDFTRQLPEEYGAPIPVEGKAGTLIVFHTDVFHHAGTVHSGERNVLRGHTRVVPPEPKPGLLARVLELCKRPYRGLRRLGASKA